MTRFICISSGKGGVGKTTTAVNLASSLHHQGHDVVLVEGNVSTPHIHLYLDEGSFDGCLHDAIHEKAHIARRIYQHETGLRIVPANTKIEHLKYPHHEGFKYALSDLEGFADIVVIDGSPGFGREALAPIEVSDEILIVTTPEHTALEDAKRAIEVAQELDRVILGVALNMVRKDRYDHKVQEIEEFLGVPVIVQIPHDNKVRSALRRRHPVVHAHPKSKASKSFFDLAELLIGPRYAENLRNEQTLEKQVERKLGL